MLIKKDCANDKMTTITSDIYTACKWNESTLLRKIFDGGAPSYDFTNDIDVMSNGVTPLFVASEKGHEAIVRMLLQCDYADKLNVF